MLIHIILYTAAPTMSVVSGAVNLGGRSMSLVTVVSHQFITLTIDICVQHGGREAPRRAGLSAAAETCRY